MIIHAKQNWQCCPNLLFDDCFGSCLLIPDWLQPGCCPCTHSPLLPCKKMAVWKTELQSIYLTPYRTFWEMWNMWSSAKINGPTTTAWRMQVHKVAPFYVSSQPFHRWHCQCITGIQCTFNNLPIHEQAIGLSGSTNLFSTSDKFANPQSS